MKRPAGVLLFAFLLTVATGCARQKLPFANLPQEPAEVPGERIVQLARTVEKRPLLIHLFGPPPYDTFIFAGLHGDEQNAADVGAALLKHLREQPELWREHSVALMPAANPDGLVRSTRYNANGVDLNRNFPSQNWRRLARTHKHGREPGSEIETQAVLRVMSELRPARAISIHSIHGNRECNLFEGPAGALAELMARHNGYPVKTQIGYPTPGSFAAWAGRDQGIAAITLELPRNIDGQAAWEQNRAALAAVITAVRD